ncbi:MAG: hypothetical protein JW388_1458 [Nitrospira sp.]|nr:hypothetical protein [Nitrospira sp.]
MHFLSVSQHEAVVILQDQHSIALNDRARLREIQRHDRQLVTVDVEPDIQFGPVRQRKDSNALPFVEPRVIEIPKFGALTLRIPSVVAIAKTKDALLGTTLLFVAARTADGCIVASRIERLPQRLGLHHIRMHLAAVREWRDPLPQPFLIGVDPQVDSQPLDRRVSKRNHLAELPCRIDMQ